MSTLLPFLVIGLASGSLYGLAGLGLVLTYRTSGVLNFGHGAIAAAGAFVFYTLHFTHHVPWPIAVLVTLALFAIVGGYLLERLTRGLTSAPPVVGVLLTTGLFLAVMGSLLLLYGDVTRRSPQFLPESGFKLTGVLISWSQVITTAIALGGAVGLYVFLRSSRLGVAMRGVVDNASLLGLTGGRPNRVRRVAWMLGSSSAALSGILLAPTLGLDVTLLTFLVVQAFGAAAIGTFSSLPLTYVGGLVIGVVSAVSTKYLSQTSFRALPPSVPFLVLVAVLVVVSPAKLPRPPHGVLSNLSQLAGRSKRATASLVTVGTVPLLLIPLVTGTYLPTWINACSYVVLFGSLALLVWTSGQISLCHMAFAAVGAATIAHLTAAGVPWVPALVLAGLTTVPAGVLVAIPAIRVSGIYLALATLGFGILMQNVVYPTSIMFGPALLPVRTSRPRLGLVHGADDTWFYFIVLTIAALTCLGLVLIQRGRLGQLLAAMATSPDMLSAHGLSVNVTRLTVYCISAFLAGIAGGMQVSQYGAAIGTAYGPLQSLLLVAVLAICGTRPLRSALLAAVLFAVVPGYLPHFGADRQILLFGIAALVAGLLLTSRDRLAHWSRRLATDSDDRARHGPVAARSSERGTRWTPGSSGNALTVAHRTVLARSPDS